MDLWKILKPQLFSSNEEEAFNRTVTTLEEILKPFLLESGLSFGEINKGVSKILGSSYQEASLNKFFNFLKTLEDQAEIHQINKNKIVFVKQALIMKGLSNLELESESIEVSERLTSYSDRGKILKYLSNYLRSLEIPAHASLTPNQALIQETLETIINENKWGSENDLQEYEVKIPLVDIIRSLKFITASNNTAPNFYQFYQQYGDRWSTYDNRG